MSEKAPSKSQVRRAGSTIRKNAGLDRSLVEEVKTILERPTVTEEGNR